MPQTSRPVAVTLLITSRFPLLSLAMCTEALRVANREAAAQVFAWTIATADGAPIESSSGIPMTPHAGIDEIRYSPVTIVMTSYDPEGACTPAVLSWLRRQDRQGGQVGCVDTAALVLGRTGLLQDYRVAAHRESVDAFYETLGDAITWDRQFTCEPRRLSSAGGSATFDMVLALIDQVGGAGLGDQVAHALNHQRLPDEPASQSGGTGSALPRIDKRLARLVELMQANLETPLRLSEICALARVEDSTARRLFHRHLKTAPSAYYLCLRLERARGLLVNSHAAIKEIAHAVGFADTAAFSHAFKRGYGLPPSKARQDRTGLES